MNPSLLTHLDISLGLIAVLHNAALSASTVW
jgi:hypothetical protein